MPQTINTNLVSLNAQRNLSTSQSSLATSMQRLSSGLRVNSAKDDAAGLAIAERMNTQVRGMNVAMRNANDGISLAQTAEGALGKVGDMLQRMRELAVQSANATNSDSRPHQPERGIHAAGAGSARVLSAAPQFNGQNILADDRRPATFQIGANNDRRSTRSRSTSSTDQPTPTSRPCWHGIITGTDVPRWADHRHRRRRRLPWTDLDAAHRRRQHRARHLRRRAEPLRERDHQPAGRGREPGRRARPHHGRRLRARKPPTCRAARSCSRPAPRWSPRPTSCRSRCCRCCSADRRTPAARRLAARRSTRRRRTRPAPSATRLSPMHRPRADSGRRQDEEIAWPISSPGIGSGLDVNSIVGAAAGDREPAAGAPAEPPGDQLQTQLSSYGALKSRISGLAATRPTSWPARPTLDARPGPRPARHARSPSRRPAAPRRAPTGGSAAAGPGAVGGHHAAASAAPRVGTGTLMIEFGSWNRTPDLHADRPLTSAGHRRSARRRHPGRLRDKINAADAGVTAAILNDSSGSRLVLRSTATGAESGFRITATDDDGNPLDDGGLSRLAFDPPGGAHAWHGNQRAVDARASVNGSPWSRHRTT